MNLSILLVINYFILFFPGVLFRQLRWSKKSEATPWAPLLWLGLFSILGGVPLLASIVAPKSYSRMLSWESFPDLQIFAWILHTLCLIACLWAQRTMKNSWRLPTVAARDQKLVCAGPYKIFRHPIYFFVLGTNLALALCLPGPMTAALVLISVPVFRHFAIVEEAWMRQRFGDEYERYMERVPRWGLSWPKSRPGS